MKTNTDKNRETLFALNRERKVAICMEFASWEQLQVAFRVGIRLPDGSNANGIGRCPSEMEFMVRCRKSGFNVLEWPIPNQYAGACAVCREAQASPIGICVDCSI